MTKREDWVDWLGDKAKCDLDFELYERRKKLVFRPTGDWVTRYVRKSDHNLDFANFTLKFQDEGFFGTERFYDWAITAFYYSIYHSALALLAKANLKSNDHTATLCAMTKLYYHKDRKLTQKEIGTLAGANIGEDELQKFIEAKGLRERASYDASAIFEKSMAELARRDAISFVNKAKDILATAATATAKES